MPRLIPETVQRQLDGLTNMTAHARHLFQQGVLDRDDLYKIEAFEAEQRGQIADVETYKAMREDGTWDRLEQVLNDPRSGSASERELLARKTAAHFIATNHLSNSYHSYEDQEAGAKRAHEEVKKFIDVTGFGDDPDAALMEAHVRLNLREKVEKPVEEPSWSKPLQKIDPDDAHARDFRLRDESTKGTRRWNDSHDAFGMKRNARGEIISEKTLREDADRPKPKRDERSGLLD